MNFLKKFNENRVLHENEGIIEGIFLNYSVKLNHSFIFYL
jgi:hypothetical protein